ncbi:hypothetical protein M9H77_37024 [Catharanthus roseus]|uniref:Uncharacterized protein n=1 Tax=Catharanthus roseus TaxID=4058 RepID=A0ACB9ZTH2_CATRO|nr:hypothetical protein M9H77_37024 [Catharanthus roseus]
MGDYQEIERFGMENDYEGGQWIGGEFYSKKRKKNPCRPRMIDSDYEGLGSSRKRRKDKDLYRKPDLTKPFNFVSTGTVMPNQEIDRNAKEENQVFEEDDRMPSGLGFAPNSSSKRNLEEDGGIKEDDNDFLPTAFGKKIMEEKSMLAKKSTQIGRREPESGDVGSFEKHTKGIGMKLLEKMGYKGGGLGKNEQGIVAPIEAKLRPKNMGMGFNDYKETKPPALQELEEKALPCPTQPSDVRSKEKSWSKQARIKEKVYITAEELLAKKEEQNLEVVQKVFDMRGPLVRVLTSLENLNAEEKARENDIPMPELQHNIRLIVDLAELDIQKVDRDLRNERETVVALQKEKEKLQMEASRQKKQLDNMEHISNILEELEVQSSMGTATLDSLAKSFIDLQSRYAEEYKLCTLSSIACAYAVPLFSRVFQGWDPLQNPTHGWEVLSKWKNLQLIMEVVFPAVRISGTNTWQARDPEPMLRFLESWEKVLPTLVLQTILDNIVMPKICAARLETCYHTIRDRLESVLHAWHPSDMSAYYILSPWKTVFDAASWEKLMVRHIIPKLLAVMHEFQVNPANQKHDQFYWVRNWASVIPIHHTIHLMDVFFNKWQEDLLPPELLANEHIRYRLNLGLDMMNQAIEGMEVVQPGLRENIRYLRVREQRQFEKAAAQAQERASSTLGSGSQGTGMGSGLEMSLKEVIEVHAQHNGLLFKPKPGRMQDGHQIYGFGNISIIVDSLNQKVFAQIDDQWSLVSLEQLRARAILCFWPPDSCIPVSP